MKKKLKTWEEFENTVRHEADQWKIFYEEYDDYFAHIKWRDNEWRVSHETKRLFGKTVYVKECNDSPYFTHEEIKGNNRFHEIMFKSDDFIEEKEFMI